MYGYIKGTISKVEASYVIIDNSGIGYIINVANPYQYQENKEYTIYTYTHIREDEYSLYGFTSYEEKEMFLKLISVKGLGPKMALPIIASGSINGIIDAINRENILYLKKFPKIGDKVAKQIILDLKGKLGEIDSSLVSKDTNSDLIEALVALGYKQIDIKKVLPSVNIELKLEDQIREALKLLLK